MIAGANHFIDPTAYHELIPPYFGFPVFINYVAGGVEIILGLGLLYPKTRLVAAFGIMALLLAFIPSHIYFIQIGSCLDGGLCVPEWVAWVRLMAIQPLLLFWAWSARK